MPDYSAHLKHLYKHIRRSMIEGRRVARVDVNPEVLLGMCTSGRLGNGNDIVVDGIPPGATIVYSGYDLHRGVFYMIVEHESFDVVEGDLPPTLDVTMHVNYLHMRG